VENGRYANVNFVASSLIAGLTNLCGIIPFQFGGDGAVALIPPEFAAPARLELARVRDFARTDFNLRLRVGLLPVSDILQRGGRIAVARYEPTAGNCYGQFLGNGIELAENALKGRGDPALASCAEIAALDGDATPPNLAGLSCRWSPVKPTHGKIIALVTRNADNRSLHRTLQSLAGLDALNLGDSDIFTVRWPPRKMMLEVRARRGSRSLAATVCRVLFETLIAYAVFKLNLTVGRFDPARYRRELASNLIHFSRSGHSFCLVFDCPEDKIEPIRSYLTDCAAQGLLQFGMHVADHALMTCLVGDAADGRHIHFADGGDGGYFYAATALKAANALAARN
jgi:hypothetical protein